MKVFGFDFNIEDCENLCILKISSDFPMKYRNLQTQHLDRL